MNLGWCGMEKKVMQLNRDSTIPTKWSLGLRNVVESGRCIDVVVICYHCSKVFLRVIVFF